MPLRSSVLVHKTGPACLELQLMFDQKERESRLRSMVRAKECGSRALTVQHSAGGLAAADS